MAGPQFEPTVLSEELTKYFSGFDGLNIQGIYVGLLAQKANLI
jgi:hypothetical protein